jgi:hypothetical protein
MFFLTFFNPNLSLSFAYLLGFSLMGAFSLQMVNVKKALFVTLFCNHFNDVFTALKNHVSGTENHG